MPGARKKDLYLARSLGALNETAKLPQSMSNNPKILVKTADKMLKEAEVSDSLGDEERAYVLYMKYFNIVTVIKKSQLYKKQKEYYDSLMGQKNLSKAINKAEELSTSLKDRYDLVEAEQVAQKLSLLDRDKVDNKEIEEEKVDKKKPTEEVKEEKKVEEESHNEDYITPTQLYDLLQDKDSQITIMDVRPDHQFQESHLQHQRCINVPADVVPPGTTVTYIEKALPDSSKDLWSTRGQADHIILLDWDSKFVDVTIGTTLRTLKDALFKYDSTVIIKSNPLILEGGYSQWLLFYPQLTTNSKVSRPTVIERSSPATSLDFDYPDFDEAFLSTPSPTMKNQPETANQSHVNSNQSKLTNSINERTMINDASKPGVPTIDRSKKPKPGTLPSSSSLNSISNADTVSYKGLDPDSFNVFSANSINSIKSISSSKSDTDLEKDSATSLSKQSDRLTKERQEMERVRKTKEDELAQVQKEREKEEQAHQDKLAELQRKIQMLEKAKQEETKNVADLMRMKKTLNDEFKQEKEREEEDKQRNMVDESNRKRELLLIQEQEEEKKRRQEEVEKMRLDRKKKEEEEYNAQIERDNAEKRALEKARESARQEEERKRLELKEAEDKALAIRQEQAQIREQKEAEARRLERQKREEEEKARQEKERRDEEERRQRQLQEQQERERSEREKEIQRIEQEKVEKEKKERERQEKADQARKEAEEKLKRLELSEDRPKPRTIPSPNLPMGWEKRLDQNTRRYYYINHNAGTTHWEPPVTLLGGQSGTYKAKLKEEPAEPRRGLSRSNSSPNIAKMFDESNKEPSTPIRPSIDRSNKPHARQEIQPVVRPAPPKKAIQRNLNPVYGSVGRALTGLRNLGNTCYMNSTIQCLNSTSPLVTYFLTDSYLYDINRESILGSHGEVADEFSVIVKALWSGQYRCISPRDFKYMVGKHQPMFSGTDQQDTQEFLTFLLDALHEGLNKVKKRPKIPDQDNDNLPDIKAAEIAWKNHKLLNESIIVELFQGQLKSTLMCLTCRKQSVNFQAFMYLSLPIPSTNRCNLDDCLRQFLREEKMTGSSRWRCPKCKVDRDSVKKIDIWKLPRILLIGLNRFVYDGPWRQKINGYVDFPVKNLDFNSYIQGPKSSKVSYNLYGISNHFGTMDGGHYTAYCRNPSRQNWYKYDDDHVYEMSQSEIKTSAAFVLYYTSIELQPPEFRQLI